MTEAAWEAQVSEQIHQIVPSDRIEGLLDIELEKEGRGFRTVKASGQVSDIHEVVVDASLFYESALGI